MVFLETPVFTRQIRELVDDDRYRGLQAALVVRPDAGDVIPRSGGLRKMLLCYAKNVQDDLSEDQLRTLRALIREEFG